ncbi:hypothetical protein TSMEX_000261 [Taenia solium]|eukprot:TsM_000479900 transcript=TsM_000479900 gene=TsM_000479900
MQTIVLQEPLPLIKKEDTVTVSAAPPMEVAPAPILVRFGTIETPLVSLHEGIVASEPGLLKVSSMGTMTTVDFEPNLISTQYSAKRTSVDTVSQVTYDTEQHVVVTEDIASSKMKLQIVGVQAFGKPESMQVVPSIATIVNVRVQALGQPEYMETTSQLEGSLKMEASRPAGKSTAIMTDVFIEPERHTVVRAVPPAQPRETSTAAISSVWSPDYADVSITAPSKEILTTVSSVTEPPIPKVPTKVTSVVTELLPLGVDAWTESMKVEEPVPLIKKEGGTPEVYAAPPTETAPVPSLVKLGLSQTPSASKAPNFVCTSTMTVSEIAPQITDVAYAAPPHPLTPAIKKADVTDNCVQTQPAQVAESLTMTEVSVVKSVSLQTEENEFIWEEEVPSYPTMKYNPVETIVVPSKHRNIQCSLIESPPESIEPTREPEDFAYEEVEVNETYYKFTDTQVMETQTTRVPLMHWAEFYPSTGFSSVHSSREFYELLRSVRESTWNRCVTEELEEYFSNVGYSKLNPEIYKETLRRSYLKEYSSQVEMEEEYMGAEIGVQFPYETIVHEPFEYEMSTKSEQSVEESYTMRRSLGQIIETGSTALPTTKDFGVQIKMESETSVKESSVIEIKKTDQTFAYQQPAESKIITIERGYQTDFDSTVTAYRMEKTDTETAYSQITDVVHMVDEPMYVKTQVYLSTVTEASQTEPLSHDYLRQQLEGLPKPEARPFRHDCLHDLDILTYFFDQDTHEEEYLQREQESYLALPLGQPVTEKLQITIRQRIVEYELCDMVTQIDARDWNDIREVASPITGLFAPVSFAVRQGWIQLGGQNEYIDPTTGHTIPLETALAQGRIRFANTASPNGKFTSSLVYIERESAVQERADATFILNTVNREYIPIRQAQLDGLIREDENQVTWVLNSLDNTWITAEEAISQNILKVDKIYDQETDEEVKKRQQQSVVRAYHVTAIRPGGEPCEWLRPEDAVRFGLFNRQTGDVAAEWPSRPSYQPFESGKPPSSEFAVSQWCNFLTARQAGWIRVVPEMNINKWIPLSQPSGSGGNRRLLSTSVSLLLSRARRLDQDQPDFYKPGDYQRSGRSQPVFRQYPSYAPGTMSRHRLGSGSHSPEYGTESSRTPPYLTEVGEFEHSDVYVLSSSLHEHMETSVEQISHQERHSGSLRTLEEGDGQFYSYPATSYPSDEPVSTIRHEFEEMHAYEDQSSTWSRSRQYAGHLDEQTRYSRSEHFSRYTDSDQRR